MIRDNPTWNYLSYRAGLVWHRFRDRLENFNPEFSLCLIFCLSALLLFSVSTQIVIWTLCSYLSPLLIGTDRTPKQFFLKENHFAFNLSCFQGIIITFENTWSILSSFCTIASTRQSLLSRDQGRAWYRERDKRSNLLHSRFTRKSIAFLSRDLIRSGAV